MRGLCRRWRGVLVPIALAGLVLACGDPIGTPCQVSGTGFHLRDPCAGVCRQYRPVQCGDGTLDRASVCSGRTGCVAGACPTGQRCYRGTHDRSMCVAEETCSAWAEEGPHGPVLESDAARAERRAEEASRLRPTAPARNPTAD